MKISKIDLVKKTIRPNRLFQISGIMEKCELSKISAITYFKQIGVLTSFNKKGQYYILASDERFDDDDLLFVGEVGFYKGGNLLAAICHLVEKSEDGLGARELDEILNTTTHSQLPKLYRSGRLQRESALKRAGNAYIYFSSDKTKRQAQKALHFAPQEEVKVEEPDVEEPHTAELGDVIEVLLTLISHPDFSSKSVALSLQRRGKNVSSNLVEKAFLYYGLSKKKP
ncbi:MAG: hypothetical protein HRT88_17895 [Lentisphaeraceae bacterium]|nr:hypothetical protein [Lentisphaeraceae bacterium]